MPFWGVEQLQREAYVMREFSITFPWLFHDFPGFSMTYVVFHDYPGLEFGLPKSHDFP